MEEYPKALEICVEVARGGRIKRRPDGSIDFMSPFASPFNYGSASGRDAADGDPEDAIVLGPPIEPGTVVQMQVWGRVEFFDAGLADHKWVCGSLMPCLLYTSPSPRDRQKSRMPSSA